MSMEENELDMSNEEMSLERKEKSSGVSESEKKGKKKKSKKEKKKKKKDKKEKKDKKVRIKTEGDEEQEASEEQELTNMLEEEVKKESMEVKPARPDRAPVNEYTEMFVLLDDKKLHLKGKFDKPMLEIQKLRFSGEMDDEDNGFEVVRKYAGEYFGLLESDLTEKYDMVETFKQFKPPKLKRNEALKMEDLRIFMIASIKIAMGYNLIEPEPSLDEKIRFRMRRFYKKLESLYSNKVTSVNNKQIFAIDFFPGFFDELIAEMHRSEYTEEDKELEPNLIKIKGIFPLGKEPLPGMPKSEFLYYSFLQKNQKGFCFDDLRQIFANFNLFGFAKKYFVDEPEKGSNYEDNKLKINHFLAKNKDDLQAKFRQGASIADYRLLFFDIPSDYNASHNKKRRFRYDRMNINDVFNYLRRVFEDREEPQMLKFYHKREDTETYFIQRNSMTKVLKLAKEYFFKYLGISQEIYDNVNYVEICYDVVWEFFDFLLRINGHSYIDYHSVDKKHTKIFDLRTNLVKTIEKYKKKEELCNNDFEIKILRTTIAALEKQLGEFEGQATEQDTEKIKAEIRLKNLKEIFNFYSKQHVQISANDNTFDHLKVQLNTMGLSDWTCFCRDFKLNSKETNLNHRLLTAAYKFIARGKESLDFNSFLRLVNHIADILHQNNPILNTHNKRLESLFIFLDLLDENIKRRFKQAMTPFDHVGIKLGPTPKEKEDAERLKEYEKDKKLRMKKFLKMKVPGSINSLAQSKYYKVNPNYRSDRHSSNHYLRRSLLEKSATRRASGYSGIQKPRRVNPFESQSYLSIQKLKNLPDLDGKDKKVTWMSLQDVRIRELRTFFDQDFEPNMLVNDTEPEDKAYLSEFGNVGERSRNLALMRKKIKMNKIKGYGSLPRYAKRVLPRRKVSINKKRNPLRNSVGAVSFGGSQLAKSEYLSEANFSLVKLKKRVNELEQMSDHKNHHLKKMFVDRRKSVRKNERARSHR